MELRIMDPLQILDEFFITDIRLVETNTYRAVPTIEWNARAPFLSSPVLRIPYRPVDEDRSTPDQLHSMKNIAIS
jgi:hypothetical protein